MPVGTGHIDLPSVRMPLAVTIPNITSLAPPRTLGGMAAASMPRRVRRPLEHRLLPERRGNGGRLSARRVLPMAVVTQFGQVNGLRVSTSLPIIRSLSGSASPLSRQS